MKPSYQNAVLVLTLLLRLLNPSLAQEQTISGQILDAQTKEGLGFAQVFLSPSQIPAVADEQGYFILKCQNCQQDTLIFSFMGYEERKIPLGKKNNQRLKIYLQATSYTFDEGIIQIKRQKPKKDSAALALWREVLAHKRENNAPSKLKMSFEEYLKSQFDISSADRIRRWKFLQKRLPFVLEHFKTSAREGDYLPLLLKETLYQVHSKEGKEKRRLLGERFSGMEDASTSDFIDDQLEDINPYDNTIYLFGKSFTGPFALGANLQYHFFLLDSMERNGQRYHRLDFVGRNRGDLTFLGQAWIHLPSYAIVDIHMEVSPHANVNFLHQYYVEQRYQALGPDSASIWQKDYEYVQAKVAAFKRKSKDPINITLRKSLFRRDWNIDQESLSDSLFKGSKLRRDSLAYKRPDSYWQEHRHEALNQDQEHIYPMIDSVKNSRVYKWYYALGHTLFTGHIPIGKLEIGHLLESFTWNEVEGYRLKFKMRTSRKWSRDARIYGYLAYGTEDQAFKGGLGFRYQIPNPERKWRQFWGEYRYDYSLVGQLNRFQSYDNLITTLTRIRPLDRLMKIQAAELNYGHAWFSGFNQTLAARHKIFYALPNNGFDFSNGDTITERFSVSEFHTQLHWGPGETFFRGGNGGAGVSLGSKLPVFYLDYTFRSMLKVLGQDFHHHKLDFRIRHRWNWRLGYTRYQFAASKIFGPAPYPVLNIHLGNENFINNTYAFNLMNFFEHISDASVSLLFEHHFDGLILNKLPLIKRLKWREVFIFRGLYGSLSERNANLMQLPLGLTAPGWYGELGFGVENVFKIFRIDFLWRLRPLEGSEIRNFGIKLGFTPNF